MFLAPITPSLVGDLYKQYINEIGAFRAWYYDGSAWIEYAEISEITFEIPWPDIEAEDQDVYWSGPTKWTMSGSEWVIQTSDLRPPPDSDTPIGPTPPDFPTEPPPEHGDTHTDQHGNSWWWYDGVWNTHPDTVMGDIYTYDVNTDETESADINNMLRVIPDIDLMELKTQKDVNWAMANALEALDAQVEINANRLDDLTMLIPGAGYVYELPSTMLRPPAPGTMYFVNGMFQPAQNFGEAIILFIHHSDHTGTEHTLENIQTGDSIIIEHNLDAQDFGRYQIDQITHHSDHSEMTLEVISHRGSMSEGMKYDVLAFPDINVSDKPSYEYVDQGLAEKINSSGNNDLDLSESQWKITGNSKTFIHVMGSSNTLGLYHVRAPNDPHHAANKQYVDDQVADIEAQTGYTGSAGPMGYTGSQGATGTGTQGDRGYTGSKGAKGYSGSKGNAGSSGVQIELYNNSSPPSSKSRGTLLMTSNNNLYVYI